MPYYLYDGQKPIGPFEPAELFIRPGFGPTTLVYPLGAVGAEAWKPASSFPDLALPAPKPFDEPAALGSPADKLVLVVDDDENVRAFLEMSVKNAGFKVATAADGIDATTQLNASPPDLIVTDLMMPGVGGYEFLRSLQGGSDKRIPVFVVTGCALEDSTISLVRQEGNVVEFIPKPIGVPALVAALHKHLKTAPK